MSAPDWRREDGRPRRGRSEEKGRELVRENESSEKGQKEKEIDVCVCAGEVRVS